MINSLAVLMRKDGERTAGLEERGRRVLETFHTHNEFLLTMNFTKKKIQL